MIRLTFLVGLLASSAALAAPPADDASSHATGAQAAKPATATAGSGQLMPPLPPLASLPASVAASVDEAAPEPASPSTKKSKRTWSRKMQEAPVRMVVTEPSRKYLADVERQLDAVLLGGPADWHTLSTAQAVAISPTPH